MKKLLIAGLVAVSATFANADLTWNWWLDKPNETTDISLGIASKCKTVNTLEASVFYSASPVKDALQFTFFGLNNSEATCPLQLAFINNGKAPCVQLGFANINKSSTFDWGFVNFSDDAKFQLGFLNFNKKGFLPVFIIVNFNPEIFK